MGEGTRTGLGIRLTTFPRRPRAGRRRAVGLAVLLVAGTLPYAAALRAAEPSAAPSAELASPTVEPSIEPSLEPSPSLAPTGAPSATPSTAPSPTATAAPAEPPPADPDPGPVPASRPVELPEPGRHPEVVAERTATSETFDLGDGRRVRRLSVTPLHYQPEPGGAWAPIDLTFRAAGAGAVVDRSPVTVRVADPVSGELVRLTGPDGWSVGISALERAAGGPRLARTERAVADLAGALDGLDLRVSARSDGANLFLVVPARPAVPAWTYVLDLVAGERLVPDGTGALDIVDADGARRARIGAPYALDSTPDERTGSGRMTSALRYETSTTPDGRTSLTVAFEDPDWLADATYPVYVDPSVTLDLPGSNTYGDAHINAGNPNQNYANYQRPDSPTFYEMWLGESPSDPTYVNHALLKWDISSLHGLAIDAASVKVRPYHAYYDAPTARGVWARRIGSSWTESTVTWTTRPSWTSTSTTTTCAESTSQSCVLDATYWTRTWLNGTNSNWGIALDTNGNNKTYWKRLISSEQAHSTSPDLWVEYHDAVTPLVPLAGTKTASRTLAWAYDAVATLADQGAYRVEVSTSSTFGTVLATSGDLTGTAGAWAIPTATTLTAGTTYHWRVRVRVGTFSGWSPWYGSSFVWVPDADLGVQPQHTTESWDLGGGDELAVNVATGNLLATHPVADLPIRGGSLPITLAYNSFDPADVGLGPGWRLDLQRRLAINGSTVTFTDGTGARHAFSATGTVGTVTDYGIPATIDAQLRRDTGQIGAEFTLTYRDRSVDVFKTVDSQGLLRYIRDRMGTANQVTIDYAGTTTDITTVTDPAGRQVVFSWNADTPKHVTQIRDWGVVSGGVVQASGTPNRATRFFYAGGVLTGWAEPPNTASSSCASAAAYLTCLTYTGGRLATVAKTHTTAALSGGAIGAATAATVTTTVSYRGTDVAAVRDATQSSSTETAFSRTAPATVRVVRAGTPATTTDYGLVADIDTYGRVASVTRWLGSTPLVTTTEWHTTYPTKVWRIIEDAGGSLERTITNTWAAGSIGPRLTRVVEPLDATDARWTDHTYNSRDDVTQTIVSRNGSATDRTISRICFNAGSGCGTGDVATVHPSRQIDNYVDGTKGGAEGHVTDVTVEYQYDPDGYGLRIRETRFNYAAGGSLLDSRAMGYEYDSAGNLTKEIAHYANGQVSTTTPDDIDPNPTTNARTDLTSVHTYDTAGNRTSTADPRRAIEAATGESLGADDFVTRWTYDALDRQLSEKTPTTPDITITQKTATTTYDEFGLVRTATDLGGRVTGSAADRAGRTVATFEDTDGTGGADAVQTSALTYDAAGRVLTARDERQVAAYATYGETRTEYDALGRATKVTEAAGSNPSAASMTLTTYDALDRVTCVQVGWLSGSCATASGAGQSTVTAYDAGGRATSVDDEFTCTTTTYDWRDLATHIVEGRTPGSPCTGTGTRTIVQAFDGLGRRTSRAVSGGDVLEASTLDSAGRALTTWSTEGSTITRKVETTSNPLDEPISEWRYTDTSGTKSAETWARSNRDAAGNETDRCTWTSDPDDPDPTWCVRADQAHTMNPVPATAATSEYDARNNRITQYTPGLGATTYDPDAAYQVKTIYLPTATGKERHTTFAYDGRHRLTGISEVVCATAERPACTGANILSTRQVSTYGYDTNDNRTQVTDDPGGGPTTRHYCYDARDQLVAVRSATGCSTGLLETYAYDAMGNRTAAPGRTYTYAVDGQLASCSGSPACNPVHDADGRLTKITTAAAATWSYLYDAEDRLLSACQATSCTGSGFARLDLVYDGEGHRTRLEQRTSAGTLTTTTFNYGGDTVVREVSTTGATTITRTFVTDEAGAIVKMTIGGDPIPLHNGTYLITWNGHGDALALSKIDTDGTLIPANRYTYSTWGTPATTTHNGYGDLGFRYLYVGQYAVTWDHTASVPTGLHYMRARHYSPEFGRFLQADPSRLETNAYAYAGNGPVSRHDSAGECWWCRALDKAVEVMRKAAPFLQKLPSALSSLGNRYGRLTYVVRFERSVRVVGQRAHGFRVIPSGQHKGWLKWVSELPGGSRGAGETFRRLTGQSLSGSSQWWRSYRGYIEVRYRAVSSDRSPAIEITNTVTRTIEKIHFVTVGGR